MCKYKLEINRCNGKIQFDSNYFLEIVSLSLVSARQ